LIVVDGERFVVTRKDDAKMTEAMTWRSGLLRATRKDENDDGRCGLPRCGS